MAKMIVKENDNVEKTLYENAYGKCWLFTTEATGGVNSWCLYQMDPANTKNLYIFSGLHRELNTEDGPLDLLVPLHLISDSYIRDNMGSRMELDTHYTCGAEDAEVPMADLFRAFYLESGLYSVTDSDYGFTVMPMKGMSLQLQFIFEENADGTYERYEEEQRERMYTLRSLKKLLKDNGFEFIGAYSDFNFGEGSDSDDRIYLAARCIKN